MENHDFKDIKTLDQYLDRINGKYKHCIDDLSHGCVKYLRYFLTTCTNTNTLERFYSSLGYGRNAKEHVGVNRLPCFQYINLPAEYKNTKFWISFIPTLDQIGSHHDGIRSYIILSFDEKIENLDEFIAKDAYDYYFSEIAERKEKGQTQIYVFEDGYWEKSKTNSHREIDTLFLNDHLNDKIINRVNSFSEESTKDVFKRLGIPYKMNILLYGPPGTGKSSIIEMVAAKLDRNIRYMNITSKMNDIAFSKAVSTLDHEDILVCEDIDCLFVDRKSNDKHKNSMTFSGLLNCFDGITGCKDGLIIFLTTNYKCNLDSALLRPGRIDLMEEIHYMKKDTIERMIRFYFQEKFNQEDFEKFYDYIRDENITGAIMSNFLLNCLLKKDYLLYRNKKIIGKLLDENNYEKGSQITQQMYS